MEKKRELMKSYLIKRNNVFVAIMLLCLAVFYISGRESIIAQYDSINHADFMQGFVTGFLIVMLVFCIYNISKNFQAMKDDTKLTRLYNELHDERAYQIESKAGIFTMSCSVIVMLVLAIIVSFFSFEATLALLAAIFIQAIIKKISKAYYTRTYTGEE
ncbi:MAG: hypothetical protein K6E13_09155 [Lachnospiraceae bacterium]|nr:hypothetical protein [Lachnospiraceae bacterium]